MFEFDSMSDVLDRIRPIRGSSCDECGGKIAQIRETVKDDWEIRCFDCEQEFILSPKE